MYQIFYIDVDEEITSVIDRLRKSKTTENFFVVSPRALILQSVVSLKLLKNEASKLKKQIAIVVNDKDAKMKIEKAGILSLASLRGLEGGEEVKESFSSTMEIKNSNQNKYKNTMERGNKKTRLQEIGTDNFFSGETPKIEEPPASQIGKADSLEAKSESYPQNKINPMPEPSLGGNAKNSMDVQKEKKTSFFYAPEKNFDDFDSMPAKQKEYGPNRISEMDPYKEKLVEGFFNPETKRSGVANGVAAKAKEEKAKTSIFGGLKKVLFFVFVIILFAGLFFSAYLFLPKATISVTTSEDIKKINLEIIGDSAKSEIDAKGLVIPAKVIEREDSSTYNLKATGKKGSSSDVSKKAKGKVTIYNEYSQESQSLVATTRLLSTDGKLFRLTKGVTVPGMSGSTAGKVEAEIIADQPGEDYNIEPTDFKIPGFEGSPKYDKFYAKSTVAMSGGGKESVGGITVVSQSDLDNAKNESEAKLKEQILSKIKEELSSGQLLLEGTEEVGILESLSTSRVNEAANSFDYKVKEKVKVIVFSENDLKKIIIENYQNVSLAKIKLSYEESKANFDSGKITIKIKADIPFESSINWDDFKKKMLGKNDGQIKEILKEYPQIEKVNVDFWPNFMSQKIPQIEKRVNIVVEKASN